MNLVKKVRFCEYMIFNDAELSFCEGVNLISGDNSTGKTIIIKTLYSIIKSIENIYKKNNLNADMREQIFVEKFQGVFRPDDNAIGRLVSRKRGSNKANIEVEFSDQKSINISIGNKQKNHISLNYKFSDDRSNTVKPIYIPPKEIIASTENFGSLYREYQIAFEETYFDLCYLLEKPVKKGKYTKIQDEILKEIFSIINGKVIQKEKKFYLKIDGQGEFEMGLLSEGFRKIATLAYLIQNGSLDKNSIIFWDEPESNMNPKMIWPVVEMIFKLAQMGVQIFITTHSYFVQQAVNIISQQKHIATIFFSLYENAEKNILVESAESLSDLSFNSIMEEFDAIYDREQELFYGHK